jgi:hypothetical protein
VSPAGRRDAPQKATEAEPARSGRSCRHRRRSMGPRAAVTSPTTCTGSGPGGWCQSLPTRCRSRRVHRMDVDAVTVLTVNAAGLRRCRRRGPRFRRRPSGAGRGRSPLVHGGNVIRVPVVAAHKFHAGRKPVAALRAGAPAARRDTARPAPPAAARRAPPAVPDISFHTELPADPPQHLRRTPPARLPATDRRTREQDGPGGSGGSGGPEDAIAPDLVVQPRGTSARPRHHHGARWVAHTLTP